jgi:hypothetical protein|tara:strand:+ start:7 stop:174 length:168 start_codon:yes stop_codon:yes gene_type:complete
MYVINNKFLLNQLLWVLKEENKFYNNFNEKNDYNSITNYVNYIETIYKLIQTLEK